MTEVLVMKRDEMVDRQGLPLAAQWREWHNVQMTYFQVLQH